MQKSIKKTSPVVKMTLKKIKSFSTTGIIPYFLFLLILVGVFSFGGKAEASEYTDCVDDEILNATTANLAAATTAAQTKCAGKNGAPSSSTNPGAGLYNSLVCFSAPATLNLGACVGIVFYFLFVTLHSWLLILAGIFLILRSAF